MSHPDGKRYKAAILKPPKSLPERKIQMCRCTSEKKEKKVAAYGRAALTL